MTGIEKCRLLARIRQETCELNGLPCEEMPCPHRNPICNGTCPVCDGYAEELSRRLLEKKGKGEEIRYPSIIVNTQRW